MSVLVDVPPFWLFISYAVFILFQGTDKDFTGHNNIIILFAVDQNSISQNDACEVSTKICKY